MLVRKFILLFFLISLIISCSKKEKEQSANLFINLKPDKTNIHFNNALTENDSLNYFTYAYIYMGGGVAAGDINNDGLIDLYFTGNQVENKLYLNKGNLKFEDISKEAKITGDNRWYTGVTMADVNNDGLLDIYCSVGGKFSPKENQLFINNGDQTFTEKAKEYGINDIGNSVQATFFDYDLDGDLDLYVANYPPTSFRVSNRYYKSKTESPSEIETDKLYRNDDNTFTNVTDEAGLRSFGLTLSATIGDVNKDGWPDLYISNDFSTPDYLFINNKNGTFTEKVKTTTGHTSFYGMGVDIADFNNDGLLDIIQVDMMAQNNRRAKANMASMNPALFWSTVNSGFHYQYMQNVLQLNNGIINDSLSNFSNISRLAGISSTDWSWGPLFADLDNDGWKDIFISNGTRREINNRDFFRRIDKRGIPKDSFLIKSLEMPSEKIDNFVFKNNGNLTFDKVNNDWGIIYEGFSNGCVYVDLDNDGDLEVVTNNIDDYASIFENKSAGKNNYLTLNFSGTAKNKFGIGVKATIVTDSIRQFQEMTLTRGFQSSVAPQLHFGLNQFKQADTIKITWPDGKEQVLTDVAANQFLTVDYSKAVDAPTKQIKQKQYLFSAAKDTLNQLAKHTENYYNDFDKEVLLPHQTSTMGPYITTGDLNNDALEDIVVSGAAGQETGIYFQSADGHFDKQNFSEIAKDYKHEDLGSIIFDADNDGDQDIYMVSGGNEFDNNSDLLQDRFYINDGNGNFTKSTDALPKMVTSGSRVYNFDFDKDGDLDLFVAGRLVPGNYPSPTNSYLLENISTKGKPKFKNVTATNAPDLNNIGMVTSAVWSDYDNDGWEDLILVGEWMPITILKNDKGNFKNVTNEMGLKDSSGWWFSIKQGDFDKDGDQDYIVGNLGLNYKYQANNDETFDIYFNDFDKNETNDIVLSYFNEGKKFPVRGRECSSQQIPAIKAKYKNYESFANASLVDIYTEKDLEKSLHYQVKSFASIYLENKGGELVSHKLPALAQISNINQIIIDDFDNDANLDVVIAGNLHEAEVETPRNDASNGLFLKGNGKGEFTPVNGQKSGLFATGNVKDLSTIKIKDTDYLIVAKNNDYLQFIKINK